MPKLVVILLEFPLNLRQLFSIAPASSISTRASSIPIEYLRYLRRLLSDFFKVPSNDVTTTIVWALATQVKSVAGRCGTEYRGDGGPLSRTHHLRCIVGPSRSRFDILDGEVMARASLLSRKPG
ncbi:hypothetical protein BJY52DRAFT_196751 [Lactarius psammicola]|nr:hypothetical protein BJY52DRAFT_196751 [Lactarius psammicola]